MILNVFLVLHASIFTTRIRRMEKVVFTVCPPPGGGTPVPGSFQDLWSQVFSRGITQSQVLVQGPIWGYPSANRREGYPSPSQRGTPVRAWMGVGYPPTRKGLARTELGYSPPVRTGLGYPAAPRDRLRCGRYASCGFPQEDFLVVIKPALNVLFSARPL